MATLNITEYANIGHTYGSEKVLVGQEPSERSQNVTFTSSAQSLTLRAKTRFVRVVSDADAYLKFGVDPTAVATDTRIEANVAEYFGIEPIRNKDFKIAAYDGTS